MSETFGRMLAAGVLREAARSKFGFKIPGFGAFRIATRRARSIVDPQDKTKRIQLPATRELRFRAAKHVRQLLNPKRKR